MSYNTDTYKRWYEANKEKKIAQVVDKQQSRRERNRQFLNEYKTGKACTDCGIVPECLEVLEFDHVSDEEKWKDVSVMGGQNYSLESLIAEIAKCEIVCANCHRVRTVNRRIARRSQ